MLGVKQLCNTDDLEFEWLMWSFMMANLNLEILSPASLSHTYTEDFPLVVDVFA